VLKIHFYSAERSGARQVFELGAAEEGAEELGAVGEVDVADALRAVLVVPLPQLRVAQHLSPRTTQVSALLRSAAARQPSEHPVCHTRAHAAGGAAVSRLAKTLSQGDLANDGPADVAVWSPRMRSVLMRALRKPKGCRPRLPSRVRGQH